MATAARLYHYISVLVLRPPGHPGKVANKSGEKGRTTHKTWHKSNETHMTSMSKHYDTKNTLLTLAYFALSLHMYWQTVFLTHAGSYLRDLWLTQISPRLQKTRPSNWYCLQCLVNPEQKRCLLSWKGCLMLMCPYFVIDVDMII